jgi:hypothetical protein
MMSTMTNRQPANAKHGDKTNSSQKRTKRLSRTPSLHSPTPTKGKMRQNMYSLALLCSAVVENGWSSHPSIHADAVANANAECEVRMRMRFDGGLGCWLD